MCAILTNYNSKQIARPKKARMPITSVIVVSTTTPARAVSIYSLRRLVGIVTPANAVHIYFEFIAATIMQPILKSLNQSMTTTTTTIAHTMSFKNPTAIVIVWNCCTRFAPLDPSGS